jgi:hypothetical protein
MPFIQGTAAGKVALSPFLNFRAEHYWSQPSSRRIGRPALPFRFGISQFKLLNKCPDGEVNVFRSTLG